MVILSACPQPQGLVEGLFSIVWFFVSFIFGMIVGMVGILVMDIFGLVSMLIAFAGIAFMFAIKSGATAWASTQLNAKPSYAPLIVAATGTLIASIGAFGFVGLMAKYPAVTAAFAKTYGLPTSLPPRPPCESVFDQVVRDFLGVRLLLVKTVWAMMVSDGIRFFLATWGLVAYQMWSSQKRSWVLQIAGALIGGALFSLVIYGDEVIAFLGRADIPGFVMKIITTVRDEVWSVVELVQILWGGGRFPTFGDCLHAEAVKMSGSIFKVASIYPKLIFVFLIIGLVRWSSQQ